MPAQRTLPKLSLLGAALCASAALAGAQQKPAPKVELFGGYSYLYPHATLTGTLPGGTLPVSGCLCAIPAGAGAAVTFDFNKWFGITGDVSGHWGSQGATPAAKLSQSSFFTVAAGPKFTYRAGHFAPFGEALFGVHHLAPQLFSPDNSFGLLTGGGLDVNFGQHFGLRVFQADFAFSNHQFGVDSTVPGTDVRGLRLQSGVVVHFGGHAAPIAAPARPVEMAAAPAIAPMPINAQPTLACSASPSMMNAGDSSTITAIGNSPVNKALSYSFSSDAGSISGSGSTAILSTAGVSAGTILVTCNVVDAAGLTAVQTVPVVLTAAPLAAVVTSKALCSVAFTRDAHRPARVDNEAKACLDDIALNLQRNWDAKLILVGSAADGEANGIAAERAVNTKAYLILDKGIDPSRIAVYTRPQQDKSVSTILVPSGATPDLSGDAAVDESAVKAQPRTTRTHARR